MTFKQLAVAVSLGGCFISPPTLHAATFLNLDIEISGTPQRNFYSAVVAPGFFAGSTNPLDPNFQTGLISSADGTYSETGSSGNWQYSDPSFNDLPSLLNSLNQPWSMVLDKGLSTERDYTMSLSLGSFPTMPLSPPVVESPLANSTIDPNSNTFVFIPSALQVPIQISLEYLPNRASFGSFVFDDQLTLPAGSTQWSAPSPLLAGTHYYFDMISYNIFPQGLAFSDPIDSHGNTLPNWTSGGNLTLESATLFATSLPEPAAAFLLFGGATLCFRRSRRTLATFQT